MIEHRRVSPGIENSSLWEARLPPCAQASANRDWGSFCATETALAHSRVCRICHDYPVRAARVSKTHELPTSSLRKRADLGDISMADRVSSSVRSRMMASVRNKDTKPERFVRSALFLAGYRYRLHRRDLPGHPDIVLPRYRTIVFVHGCFWHGHDCPRGRRPRSNTAFWNTKLDRNRARDQKAREALEALGWTVISIWECELAKGVESLLAQLRAFGEAATNPRGRAS